MRARHLIHVRWATNFEPVEPVLDELLQLKCIANLVFNDDTPGERQYRNFDLDARIREIAKNLDVGIDEAQKIWEERIRVAKSINNREAVRSHLHGRLPMGSHDDTTVEHVVEAAQCGCTLAEMPCSMEAAAKARELGMMICMGAPNYYRGGSHCGNLSCVDALSEGLVDILCSDYHFPSLLACALRMAESGMPLSSAMRLLTLNPARHLRLDTIIGSIEMGKRADLVAFHPRSGYADVAHVWVGGVRQLMVGDATAASDQESTLAREETVVA
jgi:alpha-D-ribose 1-methylphosphonate 5-triphosphate diphosphatase